MITVLFACVQQRRKKMHVRVMTSPLRATLSESDMQPAIEMHRRGAPIADIAQAVYPGYTALSEVDRQFVESAIAHAVQQWKPA